MARLIHCGTTKLAARERTKLHPSNRRVQRGPTNVELPVERPGDILQHADVRLIWLSSAFMREHCAFTSAEHCSMGMASCKAESAAVKGGRQSHGRAFHASGAAAAVCAVGPVRIHWRRDPPCRRDLPRSQDQDNPR